MNTARGAADSVLVLVPPFSFPGVTAHVFPLRASVNLLSTFCDNYLNLAPEICEFHPYFPFVFLVALDYGRMSVEKANLGWVSQHEVFFAVPLGKWRRERPGRRPIFQGWVVNTPFIFVDNPTSLTGGREAGGWPKVLARLRPSLEPWMTDPRKATRFLSLDVEGYGSGYGEMVRVLDIDQKLGQNSSLVPFELPEINPFEWLSRFTRDTLSAGWDLAQFLLGSPLSGFDPRASRDRTGLLFDSLRQLSGFLRKPGMGAVTLKQFRDARDPDHICYQALVETTLGVARYNRGGVLGLYNFLQGDITGGFRIRLHESPAFPIIESLGLEAFPERTVNGHSVSILKPISPFWLNVDLTYGQAKSLCWRLRDSPWYQDGTPVPSTRGRSRSPASYNTFAGAAQQVWGGPTYMPEAQWNVFPLRADGPSLRQFVDEYLNRLGQPHRFEPWGPYVYMVASLSRVFPNTLSTAWLQAGEIDFILPLIRHQGDRQDFILTKPFQFVDNPTLATTKREVEGAPAMDVRIEDVAQFWQPEGPVLRMEADVFTALGAGLPSQRRTVLEVLNGSLDAPACSSPAPGVPFFDLVRRLAERPLNLQKLTLKQFRDAEEPNRACYQSLVLEEWTFTRPRKVDRFPQGTTIRIYHYPSLPLVEKLGLLHSQVMPRRKGEVVAHILTPEDPFRIEMDIRIGCAEVFSQTAGFLPWHPPGKGNASGQEEKRLQEIAPGLRDELLSSGPQPLIQAFLLDSDRLSRRADEQSDAS